MPTNKRKSRVFRKTRRRIQKGGGQGMGKPNMDAIGINSADLLKAKLMLKSSSPSRSSSSSRSRSPSRLRSKAKSPPVDKILESDILFKDKDVCILKPDVKKGILVFTHYTQPKGMQSLCEAGLKTGVKLKEEGVDFGRTMIHDYIFFRAPYLYGPIDYTSIETEIESSFGSGMSEISSLVWIRIDPEKSKVYSSEIRAEFNPKVKYRSPEFLRLKEEEVGRSRKSMNEYLQILEENEKAMDKIKPDEKPAYHLFSSRVNIIKKNYSLDYPFNKYNINRQSEVLVRRPHLTNECFVKTT